MDSEKVYIIILNWNGWKDTIECLESVFRNSYVNFKVIVCDNASVDDSLDNIRKWADGKLEANISEDDRISIHTTPPVSKPISYVQYTREQAEQGGVNIEDPPLVLIQTGENLGFAGGNNIGIRYALTRNDFEYIWLLNNDTVIDGSALTNLVNRMHERSGTGICGSTLLYYNEPMKVQALGGAHYNKWLGIPKHTGIHMSYSKLVNQTIIEKKMDYVIGASMLISKSFINDIGLMCEDYFLYYEEIDWATRAKGKYVLSYASNSIVYHKEGASMGSSSDPKNRSILADYYSVKNRILFSRKYYKYTLFTVYVGLIIVIINRIRRKQWDRVIMIFKILLQSRNY